MSPGEAHAAPAAIPSDADDVDAWLFEHIFDGKLASALFTLDGMILRANAGFAELLGYSEAQLAGRSYREFLHSEGHSADSRRAEALAGRVEPMELPWVHASGRLVWLNTTGAIVRGPDRRPRRMLVQFQDMTSRRAAERALQESEERFRVGFEHAPYGMAMLDLEGRLLQVNRALATVLASNAQALVGRRLESLVHPDDAKSDGPERRYLRPDGTSIWGFWTTSLVRDSEGRPLHVIGQMIDVTARRQQEDVQAELEEQLRRAQRMEAVGRLAGGVAHDFNNMLAVILNYADFARQRVVDDPRAREYVDQIRRAALRSSGLTRQLMMFARRDVAPAQVLDLNLVIDDLSRLLRRTLGEDLEMQLELAGMVWPVRLAVTHAEQILMNLTVNARDAMPRGGRLVVSTRNVELDAERARRQVRAQPGPYVELAVRDTGVGMTPELLAVAFEPFFTTKEHGKGTGLGLSIVYGIVDDAGGFIEVESGPAKGTEFRILLPAEIEGAPTPDPAVEPGPAPRGRGESVLVVEDEPAVRALTVEILREGGYDVRTVETPEAALEICRRQDPPFDLLLTDVVMPRISGRDLAVLVQALRPGTRVLFMSGHADDRLDRHRIRSGEVAFLQKPFGVDDLLRAVRDALEDAPRPS